jgi:hypothetical protein
MVGSQPHDCLGLGEALSPPVEAAVEVAVGRIRELVHALSGSATSSG